MIDLHKNAFRQGPGGDAAHAIVEAEKNELPLYEKYKALQLWGLCCAEAGLINP